MKKQFKSVMFVIGVFVVASLFLVNPPIGSSVAYPRTAASPSPSSSEGCEQVSDCGNNGKDSRGCMMKCEIGACATDASYDYFCWDGSCVKDSSDCPEQCKYATFTFYPDYTNPSPLPTISPLPNLSPSPLADLPYYQFVEKCADKLGIGRPFEGIKVEISQPAGGLGPVQVSCGWCFPIGK